jgi:hypothetical protein
MGSGMLLDLSLTDAEKRAVEAIERSGAFDRAFYLRQYRDVAASGCDPIAHYVRWGAAEDRDPSGSFQTSLYKAKWNTELVSLGLNPLLHAVHYGEFTTISAGRDNGHAPVPGQEAETTAPSPAIEVAESRHATWQRLTRRKTEIELAMQVEPCNWGIRRDYFAFLAETARSHFGSLYAVLPVIRTPLLFRSGTSDIFNLAQVFLGDRHGDDPHGYGGYGFDLPTPRWILDLGAYCGYTAVYLANRFPDARIISVEPAPANFEVLRTNNCLLYKYPSPPDS